MGEEWALRAIKRGEIEVEGDLLSIEKSNTGSCDGCFYMGRSCPRKAITICCTGGNILKLKKKIIHE